ncbi:uncharacterized protein TNIN_49271 [Trichonephila inaurata madagascariensis]|uniref:Uncharacterized protein n=1 Tax=Trichonephila inaurata madagascariensis TaxID=2747483 RepID=A0A8X7CK68_9ARAC|nr:uncharacterized protein TNIN_49271 [Trichonephila inaurata madagascariensis]
MNMLSHIAVPAPRCLLDDSPISAEQILSNRPTSDYSTVKRSPSRGEGHFVDLGPVVDLRLVRPMSCVERQELCNNSSSSQSGASGSDGYRQYRQGNFLLSNLVNSQFISTLTGNKESDFTRIKPAFTDRTSKEDTNKRGNLLRSVPISGQRSPIVPTGSPSVTESDAIKRSSFMSPTFLS